MSVKMFLMWNSKMIIYGGRDETIGTSLLGASNLLVLRVSKLDCLLYRVLGIENYLPCQLPFDRNRLLYIQMQALEFKVKVH